MSAEEVIEAAHYRFLGGSTDVRLSPGRAIIQALKESGYTVVELPEESHPFSVGLDGDIWDDDLNESYSPIEARVMAARILAAVEAAS